MELERENFGDSLDDVEETLRATLQRKDIQIMSLQNDLDEAVEDILACHCATSSVMCE